MIANKEKLILEMQEDLFRKNGHGWYRVASGSMRPLIDVGDRVWVRKMDPSALVQGDIVLFKHDEVFVTHRIIQKISENGRTVFLQKGDAGSVTGRIEADSILGRVEAIEKEGRVLKLHYGRLRVLNKMLKGKNVYLYRPLKSIYRIKNQLRSMKGYAHLKRSYHMFAKPFIVANKWVIKAVFS